MPLMGLLQANGSTLRWNRPPSRPVVGDSE